MFLDPGIGLCNSSSMQLQMQGCYSCTSCSRDSDYICNVQCSETSPTCSLRNLGKAWCSILFHDVTIRACDGSDNAGSCRLIGGPFAILNTSFCNVSSTLIRSCEEEFGASFRTPFESVLCPSSEPLPRTSGSSSTIGPAGIIALSVALPCTVLAIAIVAPLWFRRMKKKTYVPQSSLFGAQQLIFHYTLHCCGGLHSSMVFCCENIKKFRNGNYFVHGETLDCDTPCIE